MSITYVPCIGNIYYVYHVLCNEANEDKHKEPKEYNIATNHILHILHASLLTIQTSVYNERLQFG